MGLARKRQHRKGVDFGVAAQGYVVYTVHIGPLAFFDKGLGKSTIESDRDRDRFRLLNSFPDS